MSIVVIGGTGLIGSTPVSADDALLAEVRFAGWPARQPAVA